MGGGGGGGGGGAGGGGSRFSLAHELAVALLPEPSAGSKMLAEEFGIEYDEGAEGIDEDGIVSSPGNGTVVPAADASKDSEVEVIQGADVEGGVDGGIGVGGGETLEAALGTPHSTSISTDSSPGGGGFGSRDINRDIDPSFGSPVRSPSTPRRGSGPPQPDAMAILSQSLESTEKFLDHLRRLDTDSYAAATSPSVPGSSHRPSSSITSISGLPTSSGSTGGGGQQALESITLDMIRKIEQTTRDREEQVRELLEYEREFRRIAGEAGGNEALANLEELDPVEDLMDNPVPTTPGATGGGHARTGSVVNGLQRAGTLDSLPEENSGDWEVDPDQHMREDEEEREREEDPYDLDGDRELTLEDLQTDHGGDDPTFLTSPAPAQTSFSESELQPRSRSHTRGSNSLHLPPPPPIIQPLTPAKTIPQLAHLRTYTASLISSLSTISEHAQVNGAKTTDAGRKIRALKNKMGGWRQEWETAERSRVRIERWEAGLVDGDAVGGGGGSGSATPVKTRRVDGRAVVKEHLEAFEKALAEANVKTQAIMAAS